MNSSVVKKAAVLWLSERSMLALSSTRFLPEYEFNETPHLITTPSKTQMETRLQVCIFWPVKLAFGQEMEEGKKTI